MADIRQDIYELVSRTEILGAGEHEGHVRVLIYLAQLAEQLHMFDQYKHIESKEYPGWYEYSFTTVMNRLFNFSGPTASNPGIDFVHLELTELDRQLLSRFCPYYDSRNKRNWFVPPNVFCNQITWMRFYPPASENFRSNGVLPVVHLFSNGS
jgi:hypothetical protein